MLHYQFLDCKINSEGVFLEYQQFPLTSRSIALLQRVDPLNRDKFEALAPDEERSGGDASLIQLESASQRELLVEY